MSREEIGGRIFIGGLDHNCDEEVLAKSFEMFGDITQVMVMRDRETNKSRGFAFLSFKDQSSADDAISRMHGVEIMGRCVTVRKAERQSSMAEKSRRGGFRGGRGGDRFSGRSDRYDDGRGRRTSFESYRSGGRDSGYSDIRKTTYSDSHGGGGYDEARDDGRDSRRGYGSYNDRANADSGGRSGGYDYRRGEASDRYRYTERREDFGSRGYAAETASRDVYNGRYETARARSRSPVAKYGYHEESPPRSRRAAADTRRDYSPPAAHRSEQAVREYSPGVGGRGRADVVHDRREFVDSYSPNASRRRVRDPSPEEFNGRYATRAASPPSRGRDAYAGRSDVQSRSPARRSDYPPRRSDGASGRSRDVYGDSASGRGYVTADRSGSSYNGFYKGRSETDHTEADAGRYTSTRYRGASPGLDAGARSTSKRATQRSHSPAEHRGRRY